jgi:hypothetical protein
MAGIMLVALASRVLIPPGFMPASDRAFWLQICWDGLPAGLLAQLEPGHTDSMGMDSMPAPPMGSHHPHGGASQSEHCVFGIACSAGTLPHLPLPGDFSSAQLLSAAAFASIAFAVRVVHLPQPRAPPPRLT